MEKKKTYNFIMTTFEDTAQQLIEEGFQLVSKQGGKYTFLNNPKSSKFSDKKCVFSNILSV